VRRAAAAAAGALALGLGNLGLYLWLAPSSAPPAGAADVVSAWRQGARVARAAAAAGDPRAALGAAATAPGTTVVLERVVAERRVLALGRRLFGWSFVSGRDGVRATLDGRDARLTPDDLRQAGLYGTFGVDADGVLDRLGRELGSDGDAVWKRARFRRFTVARSVLAAIPAAGGAPSSAAGPPIATGLRLTQAIKDAAHHLGRRVLPDGRFAESLDVATGAARPVAYDWRPHAEAVRFLAAVGEHFDDLEIGFAAQRGGWSLRDGALGRCGDAPCAGDGDRGDTGASSLVLLAFDALAGGRAGVSFHDPIVGLGAFLRAQQRPDGGFAPSYDRARQQPVGRERGDDDAAAVLALARAGSRTRDPADLAAAVRGLAHLVARPGGAGVRDALSADPRLCEAVAELPADATPPGALEFCLAWAARGALLQLDAQAPVPELAGGFPAGVGWMPDLRATALRTDGATATLAAALRAGRSTRSLTAIGQRVTAGLELLLREQLPGARPYLLRDPAAVAGGFPVTPVDTETRLDTTAAAGDAMLRYLELLESRGMPRPPSRRLHNKPEVSLGRLGLDPTRPPAPAR
jgi:hypothetical protein